MPPPRVRLPRQRPTPMLAKPTEDEIGLPEPFVRVRARTVDTWRLRLHRPILAPRPLTGARMSDFVPASFALPRSGCSRRRPTHALPPLLGSNPYSNREDFLRSAIVILHRSYQTPLRTRCPNVRFTAP